jgi:hypothetical protein
MAYPCRADGRGRPRQDACRRRPVTALDVATALGLLATGCATVPSVGDRLNHAVLVYAPRPAQQGTDFLAYDPNDPGSPFTLYYDGGARYGPPGRVRAFRLYTSPLF